MINFEAARYLYPLEPSQLRTYIRLTLPPINAKSFDTALLIGSERSTIKTPITGEASLGLMYKTHEVAVISWGGYGSDLLVLQLQGAKSRKSWRGTKGFSWINFFADQTVAIASIPDLGANRITMPHQYDIEGITGAKSDAVIDRYLAFVARAMLCWSDYERKYIRDL